MKLVIAILLVSLIQKVHPKTSSTTTKTGPTNTLRHKDVPFTTIAGIHGQSTNGRTIPVTTVQADHRPVTKKIVPSAHIPILISISIPSTISYSTGRGRDISIPANISFPANSVFITNITSIANIPSKALIEFPKNVPFLAIPFPNSSLFRANVLFTKNFSFSANISFPTNNLSEANIAFTENTPFQANINVPEKVGSSATLSFPTNISSAVNISFSTKTSTPNIPASMVTTSTEKSPKHTPSSTVTPLVSKITSTSEHSQFSENTPSSEHISSSTTRNSSSRSSPTLSLGTSSSSARTPARNTSAFPSSGASDGNIIKSCPLSRLSSSSIGSDLEKEEKFDDFCQNRTSQPKHTNHHDFQCVKTAKNGYVYMKTCSSKWTDSIIQGYCEATNSANSSLWLTVPVTQKGTTFKNIFCLICQNEKPTNWNFWDIGFSCFNQSTGFPAKMLEGRVNSSALKPYEAGFWTYIQAEKEYICDLHPEIPTNLNHSRCCNASATGKAQNTCLSHDSHVYADCVIQFNIFKDQSYMGLIKMNPTFKVNLTKEMISQFPHCHTLAKNADLFNIICQPRTSSTLVPRKCPIGKYLKFNSSDMPINGTLIQVKSLNQQFSKHDWFYMNETIYLCQGQDIPSPSNNSSPISTLTSGLLILSFLVLILHLLIFCSLPEKNLWDKCLFVFSIMLLVQSVSVIYGTYYYSYTRYVSILWHYSILGCSTWILILSYDYRVNLYKTTRIYTGPDTRAQIKFWFYLTFGCGLPLLLTSLIFYFAPSEELSEDTQHGRLIKHTPRTFFWVSAFLLSLASCYLQFLIAFMVFVDNRLRYTRQRLYMPGKIVLIMAATWMLTSLWMLSYLSTSDWALYLLHLLQVVFFLIFTFSQIKGRYRTNDGCPEPDRSAKKQDFAGPVNLLQPKINLEQFTEEHFESITKQFTQNDTIPRALNTYTNVDFKF